MTKINSGFQSFYIGKDVTQPLASINYTLIDATTWRIDHTVVTPELQHQGIAKELTLHLLNIANTKHIKIIPACSYAQVFFKQYPEYQSLLKEQ